MVKVIIQNINDPKNSRKEIEAKDVSCAQSFQPIRQLQTLGAIYLYFEKPFSVHEYDGFPQDYYITEA